ncbi:MAG: 30S ribosomal protein S2 [Candidatus Nanoarchaeia archaeon]|nr:30S ribosomal protein S2 [Candidatus Nanoarchaeia archaeon]
METEMVFICDPWLDKNALEDAGRIKIPVLGVCDTNNFTKGVTQIIPGNNKSAKSVGMIMYLMTKLYVEKRKMKVAVPEIKEFIDDWDSLVIPK